MAGQPSREDIFKKRAPPLAALRAVLGNNAFLLSRRDFTCWAVPEAIGLCGFSVWISCLSCILQGISRLLPCFYRVPVDWFGPLYAIKASTTP